MAFRIRSFGDLLIFIIVIIIIIIYNTFGFAGCMGVLVALGFLLYFIQEEEQQITSIGEGIPLVEEEIENPIRKKVGGPCAIKDCKSNHMYNSQFCYKHRGSKSTIVAIPEEEVEEKEKELAVSDWWEVADENIEHNSKFPE